MVDRPSEVDQVRLFIKNLQFAYMQQLQFTPFENFTTLRDADMLAEQKLAKEEPTKIGNNQKDNYHNKGEKASNFKKYTR